MAENALDIVKWEILEEIGTRANEVVQAVVDGIHEEARQRIDAAVAEIPQIAIRAAEQAQPVPGELAGDPMVDAKADARDRAWRTLAQGLVVTVLVAIVTAFGTAVAAPEFDLLTWDSWRAAVTAGGTAAVMAVTAYIQRLISPPKGQ